MLAKGEGDHDHQRATMKTSPGSSLDVIKPEFLLQLRTRPSQIHRAFVVAANVRRFVAIEGWRDSISFPRRPKPTSSPGRCCWPVSLIPLGRLWAIRTRNVFDHWSRFPSSHFVIWQPQSCLSPISRGYPDVPLAG